MEIFVIKIINYDSGDGYIYKSFKFKKNAQKYVANYLYEALKNYIDNNYYDLSNKRFCYLKQYIVDDKLIDDIKNNFNIMSRLHNKYLQNDEQHNIKYNIKSDKLN